MLSSDLSRLVTGKELLLAHVVWKGAYFNRTSLSVWGQCGMCPDSSSYGPQHEGHQLSVGTRHGERHCSPALGQWKAGISGMVGGELCGSVHSIGKNPILWYIILVIIDGVSWDRLSSLEPRIPWTLDPSASVFKGCDYRYEPPKPCACACSLSLSINKCTYYTKIYLYIIMYIMLHHIMLYTI